MGMIDSVIQKVLSERLASRGLDWIDVRSVRLSKADKTFDLDILLDGEEKPLGVKLRYDVRDDTLRLTGVETGKRWITEVLQLALIAKGGTFALPGGMVGMLLKVLI